MFQQPMGADPFCSIMHLTIFTDHTLRVLIYLGAHRHNDRLATISDIATAYGLPGNHLRKVVHHLAKQGYVETLRGQGGGVRLARAPKLINLGDVIRNSEQDHQVLVECFQKSNQNTCSIVSACTLRGILEQAMQAFFDELDRHTLASLLKSQHNLIRIFRNRTSN